jgi:hypothetical protein
MENKNRAEDGRENENKKFSKYFPTMFCNKIFKHQFS